MPERGKGLAKWTLRMSCSDRAIYFHWFGRIDRIDAIVGIERRIDMLAGGNQRGGTGGLRI